MEKKKLLSLRTLNATDKMMKMAAEAKKEMKSEYSYGYEYGMFMRCQYLKGILKVSLFFTEEMKRGRTEAHYDIFLNPEGEEWITYDRAEECWRTAKIDMLDRPNYMYYSGKWIGEDGNQNIKHYLKSDVGGYRGILQWQIAIRGDELKQKHKRETDPWDQMQEQVRALPKDWDTWSQHAGCKFHYIFYNYEKKGAKTGYCTNCQREVPVKNPRNNVAGICLRCKREITFKARGKAGYFYSEQWKTALLQKCEEGFVLRIFKNQWHFIKGKYESGKPGYYETQRIFYNEKLYGQEYIYEDYKNTGARWCGAGRYSGYYYYAGEGEAIVYKRTISELSKGILARTGIQEMLQYTNSLNVNGYIEAVKYNPIIEQLAKAGLYKMAAEQSNHTRRNVMEIRQFEGKELHKKLGITKEQLKILQKDNLGSIAWETYVTFDGVQEDVAILLDNRGVQMSQYKSCTQLTGLNINKVVRYLERQRIKAGQDDLKKTVQFYRDYLVMANDRGMDLKDDIVRLQPNMMIYHDRYLEEKNRKANEERFAEVNQRFPQIRQQYLLNKSLFEYEKKDLIVIVPKCAADIVMEGTRQHHCVGASDRYMKAMNERRSFIVFIRKKDEPEKPYYTVEIKHDLQVLQSYAAYDRQPDIEEIKKFEEDWIVEINKRMEAMKEEQKIREAI